MEACLKGNTKIYLQGPFKYINVFENELFT